MARGRMLNQSIATDKRLNSLSLEAELVYLMAIPHLDRDGLILGEPYMLASQVCPRRPDLARRMNDIIKEWIASGLVLQYDGKEDPILFFAGFAKNQGGLRYDRETPSQFSPPPGYVRTATGLQPEEIDCPSPAVGNESGNTPATVPPSSDSTPAQYNTKEEKRIVGGVPPTPQHRTRADLTAQQRARHIRRSYEGIDPRLLTTLTNGVKHIYGFDILIDQPGDDAVEDRMRDEAYRLYQIGIKSEAALCALHQAWNVHAERLKDKRPYKDQLYEVALTLASRVPASQSTTLDFAIGELA